MENLNVNRKIVFRDETTAEAFRRYDSVISEYVEKDINTFRQERNMSIVKILIAYYTVMVFVPMIVSASKRHVFDIKLYQNFDFVILMYFIFPILCTIIFWNVQTAIYKRKFHLILWDIADNNPEFENFLAIRMLLKRVSLAPVLIDYINDHSLAITPIGKRKKRIIYPVATKLVKSENQDEVVIVFYDDYIAINILEG